MDSLVTLQEIREAAARVRPFARVTPVIDGGEVSGVGRLWLKCENLQRSGAFKIRGAANMLLQLAPDVRARGVVTYSSGNHGLALALTARDFGCPAVIVMPENAPAVKADGARALGAEVIFEGRTTVQRKARAEAEAAQRGLTVVPPFDHRWIVAGQGTIGLEVLEQCPEVTTVLVPASGGGLLGGVAAAIKGLTRAVRVVAVEPAVTPRLTRSLHAGHAVTVEPGTSIADGLLAVRAGDVNFAHIAAFVDEVVTIDDERVKETVRWLFEQTRLVAEPSGAAAPAAARSGAPTTWSRDGRSFRDVPGVTVAIISGGNVEAAAFARYITPSL
jgi:threo-3-hydroxy-L-aspartate ammonia-lyase